jgi:glycosyltransferase involved in cell wall biosynthesis
MRPAGQGPLFSVIIPTYNRPRMLGEAVESVLAQTVEDFECIVVADGSPTPPVLPADPRVRLVRRATNGGVAAARNTGMDTAVGRYLTFLDDDDLYTPERLARGLEGLRRAPLAVCHRNGGERDLEGDVANVILDHLVPSLGQVSIVRVRAPRLDERFMASEDAEWWLRAAQQLLVATVPDVGYLVRRHYGPRHGNGLPARIEGTRLLLQVHPAYFATHRRARAFLWKQIGLAHLALGQTRAASRAFVRALGSEPELRTAWHLLRSLRRSEARQYGQEDGSEVEGPGSGHAQ